MTTTLKLSDVLSDLERYKYSPSSIIQVMLNRLSDAYEGKIDIVDASNPFIYLLETSCLNAVNSINEYTNLTRKLYPRLANNSEDLYRHMSDYDYLGIFSEPATGNMSFYILFSDFDKFSVYDPLTGARAFKIPRYLEVSIDNYTFTLLYPIIIRKYSNNAVSVRYDTTLRNHLQDLQSDYIEFDIINRANNEQWIYFNVPVKEVKIDSIEVVVEKVKLFKQTINIQPYLKYYFARVFYYKNNTWNEMITTHTDYVFDINKPTAVIQYLQDRKEVVVSIPSIYIENNMIGNKVRIDLYLTNGYIDVNFNNRNLNDFKYEYNRIDPDNDLDSFTSGFNGLTKLIFINDRVIGGKDELTFDEIKENVINMSIGDRLLPITNKHLEFLSNENNFKLIKDVDTLTNRMFLLQVKIPNATTRYPVSKIDLDMIEFSTTIDDLLATEVVDTAKNYLYTIKENSLFSIDNGIIKLLSKSERLAIDSLTPQELMAELNNRKYLSNMYHYVLDVKDNNPTLRCYDLTQTNVKYISFVNYNPSTGVNLSTRSANLYKNDIGYFLDIITVIKKYNNNIISSDILPILIYSQGNSHYYNQAVEIQQIDDNQILYRFYISTKYIFDEKNNFAITSFKDNNGIVAQIEPNINDTFKIVYTLNDRPTGYNTSNSDQLLFNSYLAYNRAVVTEEDISLQFGVYLDRLYRRLYIAQDVDQYQTYPNDVPLTYEEDVYGTTGDLAPFPYVDENGNVLTHIVHHAGDIVYDENGNIVYKHRAGDIMYDSNGNPIPISINKVKFNMLMLFNDYRITIANKPDTNNYYNYIKKTITKLCTENANIINDTLLENTISYVVTPKSISKVKAVCDSITRVIEPDCSFKVDVYVNNSIYQDVLIRENIDYTIIKTIDTYLENDTISKSELTTKLHTMLKDYIVNITISNITKYDCDYVKLLDTGSRLTFKKKLIRTLDNLYNYKEDIFINYINVDTVSA
jgi:hypothetical protein